MRIRSDVNSDEKFVRRINFKIFKEEINHEWKIDTKKQLENMLPLLLHWIHQDRFKVPRHRQDEYKVQEEVHQFAEPRKRNRVAAEATAEETVFRKRSRNQRQ